jgi:hypothetical protein
MPLISKEIELIFSFDKPDAQGRRVSVVMPRSPHSPGDISPHYKMVPEAMSGCCFGEVVLIPGQPRLHQNPESVIIFPPLEEAEKLKYEVSFPCVLEEEGGMKWPFRHPTERFSLSFLSSGNGVSLPPYYQAFLVLGDEVQPVGMSTKNQSTEPRLCLEIENPPLHSNLFVFWGQKPVSEPLLASFTSGGE